MKVSILFTQWTEQVELLSVPEWRTLFENFFFKTYFLNKQTHSPLFEEMKRDPYFGRRLSQLTKEGFRLVQHLPFKQEHLETFLGFLSIIRLRGSMLYLRREVKSMSYQMIEVKNDVDPDEVQLHSERTEGLNWLNRFLDSSLCEGPLKAELLLAKAVLLTERPLQAMSSEDRVELAMTYCKLYPHLGNAQKGESTVLRGRSTGGG